MFKAINRLKYLSLTYATVLKVGIDLTHHRKSKSLANNVIKQQIYPPIIGNDNR